MKSIKKLTPAMRQALWHIQKDGGLILTLGANIENPYTTRTGRTIPIHTVQALLARKQLYPEDAGLFGEKPTAWQVQHPVDQTAV